MVDKREVFEGVWWDRVVEGGVGSNWREEVL